MKILLNSQGIYSELGDGITTGFSKASNTIAKYLAKNFVVNYVATDYAGLPFEYNGYEVHRGDSNYSEIEVAKHIAQYDYDALLSLAEPWGTQSYASIDFGDTKWIQYLPIDGLPLDANVKNSPLQPDLIVPMSMFGKIALENEGKPCADVIPLSYNSEYYYKPSVQKRATVREELGLSDKFVINFVGRQQARKNLMTLLFAYAQFVKDKDDVVLLLTVTVDKHADFELLHLIHALQIDHKVKVVQIGPGSMISDQELGEVYGAADVYLSTSCSEGFDMPVIESIACGTPAIVSKYSAHIELVAQHGELINIEYYRPMNNDVNWAFININDTVTKLNIMYDDRELLAKYSKDGLKFTEKYSDVAVQPMWTELFNNLDDVIERVDQVKPVRRMKL